MSIAQWREEAAQSQNVPRNRILRDDALYDIANQGPKNAQDLSKLRSINDGFVRSARAKGLIEAISAGAKRDLETVPKLPHNEPLSAKALATLELLKVLLKASAAQHGVATKLIADASDLEKLARDGTPDIPALKGWRKELFGNDALKLKRGEVALTLSNGDVRLIHTTN